VYELEDPHFYNKLVSEWQKTSAWTGLIWQQYMAELLRVRGLNVMAIVEYQSASQMGVFLSSIELLLSRIKLFVFELSSHLWTYGLWYLYGCLILLCLVWYFYA
jgi:hypothetical protein